MKALTRFYIFICVFMLLLPFFLLQVSISLIPYCPLDKLIDFNENISICYLGMIFICGVAALAVTWVVSFLFAHFRKMLQNRPLPSKLGEVMVARGYITRDELQSALQEQRLKFGEILIGEGIITADELEHALEVQQDEPMKIGQVLKKLGYISDPYIKATLSRMNRRLGEVFVEKGYFTEEEIRQILERIQWSQLNRIR